MKRALAFIALFSLVGFATLAQISGKWDFTLSLGWKDVTITDPGATVTIPGGTYSVSRGLVTIPDKVVTITVAGQEIPVTVPGGTYICNGSITIPGGTYEVTGATVTIPEQPITVTVPGGTYTCTIPAFTFEVPELQNKTADDLRYPVEEKSTDDPNEIVLNDPKINFTYSGTVHYTYTLYQQTDTKTILQQGEGYLDLEELTGDLLNDSNVTNPPSWDCVNLCFQWTTYPVIHLPAFHRELHVDGKTFQVDIQAVDVTVKEDDAIVYGYVTIVGRKGTGFDSIGNMVEIVLDNHQITFEVEAPTLTVKQNWAYLDGGFEGHMLVFEIPETTFPVNMPDGWIRSCPETGTPPELPRPTVEIGWENIDVYVYQLKDALPPDWGDYTEDERENWVAARVGDPEKRDKLGLAYVTIGPKTYEIDENNRLVIPSHDMSGTANLGAYYAGTTTITIPERTCTITIEDKDVTVVIPAQTVPVTNGTVTIEEQVLEFEGTVTIPPKDVTVVVEGQEIEVTIPGGTYEVSEQTVTIPDQTITIPGWSQTIERVPDLSIETVLTLTYSFGAFDVTSISKFTDDGFVSQKFKISGEFGPASLSGYMEFDPSVPTYVKSWLKGTLDFAGVSLTGKVTHKPNEMHYYLTAEVDPVTVKLSFVDYCTGIEFDNVLVSLDDLSFCCGITYDASLYFTKEGFEYVKFTVDSLFDLCCGISFGAGVEFGLDYKKLSLDVNWAGIENCITVYGDVQWEEELNKVAGLDIYGWKIVCELAECTKLEILTALDPTYKKFKNIFEGDEFEYIKASFCGPGCCGGSWNFDSTIFFQPSGTLFGITRVKLNFTFPVMDSLTVKLGGEVPENSFSFGWSLTF